MHGQGNSLLLHETTGKTVFQTPRRYEVIGSSGKLQEKGYFVFNNIPVTEKDAQFSNIALKSAQVQLNAEPGFIAFRLLRPLNSDTYIVMTEWSDNTYYTLMEKLIFICTELISKDRAEAGADKTLHIFSSAPYVTTYTTKENEDAYTRPHIWYACFVPFIVFTYQNVCYNR